MGKKSKFILSVLPILLLFVFTPAKSIFPELTLDLTPPQKPDKTPSISETYANDKDGDRIDDDLFKRADKASAAERSAVSEAERLYVRAKLDEMVNIELIFNKQITQEQIDAFLSLGGKITYIYESVSYGWNGQIPLGRVIEVPSIMGTGLVLIDEPEIAVIH